MTDTIKFKRPNLRRTRAFSLAELMIATGILGIGMIIVAMAFPVALDQSRLAVESTTSQSVFNEAVNTLKIKTNAVRLAGLFAPLSTATAVGNSRLINSNTLPGLTINDFQFSSDNTYGWIAAVSRVNNSNNTYKFWIFVLREPTGIIDDATNLHKFRFVSLTALGTNPPLEYVPNNAETKKMRVVSDYRPAAAISFPVRQTAFLGNNGKIYRITDAEADSQDSDNTIIVCDQVVSDGTGAVTTDDMTTLAYPEAINDTVKITRKNPVVAVFETVISY